MSDYAKVETVLYQENYVHSVKTCKHGIRSPHECKQCADGPSDAIIALQRIHDFADDAHTRDDGHCFALSEIVALCRAALWQERQRQTQKTGTDARSDEQETRQETR
jgi:hypothetical protein